MQLSENLLVTPERISPVTLNALLLHQVLSILLQFIYPFDKVLMMYVVAKNMYPGVATITFFLMV